MGVGVRRAEGSADDLDALSREDRVEGRRELCVTITDQVTHGLISVVEHPGEVARLLSDPRRGRVGGAAGEMDAACPELEEEEHVERLEEGRLDGEEVTG